MSGNSTGHTVRYGVDDVPNGRTDWDRLRSMTEDEIERAALDDPDNPLLTQEQLESGAPVAPADRRKVPIYIRLDAEILEHYRAGGPGYQTRINEDLLSLLGLRRVGGRLRGVGRLRK